MLLYLSWVVDYTAFSMLVPCRFCEGVQLQYVVGKHSTWISCPTYKARALSLRQNTYSKQYMYKFSTEHYMYTKAFMFNILISPSPLLFTESCCGRVCPFNYCLHPSPYDPHIVHRQGKHIIPLRHS